MVLASARMLAIHCHIDNEEILWQENKLGKLTPVSLVNKMWFNNTQHFGRGGVQEYTTMLIENLVRKADDSGREYHGFIEDATKCRGAGLHSNKKITETKMFATGGDRCPVTLFAYYVKQATF